MQYLIKIRHPAHNAAPFPYEAASPYFAARSLAAESDYEPHDRIEIEVNDGRDVYEVMQLEILIGKNSLSK